MYNTHAHTLSLCLPPDHKIIATDEGREQCFCAVFPVTDFHYKVLPWVWESEGPIETRTGYKTLLVRAHQCCVFPAEWLVSGGWRWGFVREVGLSCAGPDNGWRADVNSRRVHSGFIICRVYESFWIFLPFIYSQALLSSLSSDFFFFFPALFSILLPISLIVVMPLFFFFFFLHNFEECIAVAHITVVLSNREWKRGSFSGNFIFRNVGLHWGCLNSRWFISVFDGSRASLGENKSYSWVLMKTKYQQSRGAAGQWSTTEPLPFLPFSHIPLWWHEGTFRDTVKKEICWMFFLHFLDKEHCGHANNDNEPCFHSCGSGVVF